MKIDPNVHNRSRSGWFTPREEVAESELHYRHLDPRVTPHGWGDALLLWVFGVPRIVTRVFRVCIAVLGCFERACYKKHHFLCLNLYRPQSICQHWQGTEHVKHWPGPAKCPTHRSSRPACRGVSLRELEVRKNQVYDIEKLPDIHYIPLHRVNNALR